MTLLGKALDSLPRSLRSKMACHLGAPDLRWSLRQLRRFGLRVSSAVDVGAFRGAWTKSFLEVFSEAEVLCVEPSASCLPGLRDLAKARKGVRVLHSLLGERVAEAMPFEDRGSGSSVLNTSPDSPCVKMTTLDSLIDSGYLSPPECVKLDVQGYEVKVLEGWRLGFERCEVIQCELSLLPLVESAPLLHEVIVYLRNRGFVIWDIEEFIRSPSDGALWQIDAIFVREDSPLRVERRWR